MELIQANEVKQTRDMIPYFNGLNRKPIISDYEFAAMHNMSGDEYPMLSTRKKRGIMKQLTGVQGLICTDRLVYVRNNLLYYNESQVSGLTLTSGNKQMVFMGALVVIFPDKVVYNTNTGEVTKIEATFGTVSKVTYTLCKDTGESYPNVIVGASEPEKENGTYWLDTSTSPNVLKVFSETNNAWSPVSTTYVKIASTGIGANFKKYDTVKISGSTNPDLNNDFILYGTSKDYIVVRAIINNAIEQTTEVTVKRVCPDMDYITECNNRIWGCSSANHEIYCCKLGDPTNWYNNMGTAADSYAATVGTPGVFTGAVTHAGSILFFKENVLHKVYGSSPSNFQIITKECRGVQGGCYRSLAIVNEMLYYKSRDGVMAYDGTMPQCISNEIYPLNCTECTGIGIRDKYVLFVKGSNVNEMLVYDTLKAFWYREDDTYAKYVCRLNNDMYYIDEKDNKLKCMFASTGALEDDFAFMFVTSNFGYDDPDYKYITKIRIRVELHDNSNLQVFASYDNGDYQRVLNISSGNVKSYNLFVKPQRCERMKLKFEGTGEMKLISISKIKEYGSDK